ncbi:HAD hydrolase family protein [Olsenella sp. HMSC062G07]|uniref:HAD hydrolase family protein n=1 Tax=Olsenella sp. HMSC062G07 TaxID=1739330 RepID=UPI0008A65259|nr:HAD hydrolase family protein [Olsenella sp. HMSC062G07]
MTAWEEEALASHVRLITGPVVAFFDVNGTLVYRDPIHGPEDYPGEYVCEALRTFAERGGIPVLSTGRSRVGITRLLDGVPFRGYVSMDGAYVVLDEAVIVD